MKKLSVGMVGVENFGAYRRQKMKAAACFELLAVCDQNIEALQRVALLEDATPYDNFGSMLSHPGLEGVVVSTGADSHTHFAVAAMERGLHVFVEKPLCCSTEEVARLRRVSSETARVVGVGHSHSASDPQLTLAKRYIEEGRLGTIVAFEENSSHSGGLEIKPGDWRGLAGRNPGGMLFQCGVHALHALAYLFGPVTTVQATMRYDANPNTETADVANVLLQCANGVLGTLNCYHVTAYCHEMRIFGTKGNLYLDTQTKAVFFQARKRNEVESRKALTVPPTPKSHTYENLLSWYHGIRSNTPVFPGLEDGIAAVLPVFAAEESDKSGRRVCVDSTAISDLTQTA